MSSLEHLPQEISLLKKRNTRVELEKAWEMSWQRKLGIIVTTYFVMVLTFWALVNEKPLLNALIPTLGYALSTLSMEWVRKTFINQYYYAFGLSPNLLPQAQ